MQRSSNRENRLNLGKMPNKNVRLSCAVSRHGGVVRRGGGSGPGMSMLLRSTMMDSLGPDLSNEPMMMKIHHGGVK